MSRLCGIFGRPFVDLSSLVDTSEFPELHREIVCALPRLETSYTGGSLKWMGVTAPWVDRDPYVDSMRVISEMSAEELVTFVGYGEAPPDFDPARKYEFGDETNYPLSKPQMLYLKYRYGVYFPWKVCYHLLENERWEDKHSGEGKDFAPEARALLPRTVAFIESLPFTEIGRVVLFGIEANDHAPAHRDSEPGKALAIAQSISFAPHAGKRFYVCDPAGGNKTVIDTPIYWFNDADYHGVEADPFFRYSIRVDGVFDPAFVEEMRTR